MIWFTCKQCGKTHGRPETMIGAMVFCECGQGNLVPWESTAPEPAEAPVVTQPAPVLEPVKFDPPAPAGPPDLPADRPRRRGRAEKRDPDYCFNHQQVPRTATCADCGESFCADCVVSLQGATLCGPCKNFRARRMELPPLNSALASTSLILSLLVSPLALCMLPMGEAYGTRVLSLISLLPQLIALGLGVWALRTADRGGQVGGQSLAITGVATAGLMIVLTLLFHVYTARLFA